jgi:hypothetical protein
MWVVKAVNKGNKVTCVKVVAWVTKVAKEDVSKPVVRVVRIKVVNALATKIKVPAVAARKGKVSNKCSYSTASIHPGKTSLGVFI